jgi:hypothetical protein
MKRLEILCLLIAITFATLIIFLLQPAILSSDSGRLLAQSSSIEEWRRNLMWPSLALNYILGITATLTWIAIGASFQSVKSRDTLSMETFWWILCISYGLISLAVVMGLSFAKQLIDQTYFLQFLIYLSMFSLVNVLLLYWLPTAIATPRTMRYIPPGSQLVRTLFGGWQS